MDIDFLLFLQNLRESSPAWLNGLAVVFSEFCASGFPLAAFIGIYWCFSKKLGTLMIFTFGFGNIMNSLIKDTACVYRPWIRDQRIILAKEAVKTATGYSFPSGHSTIAGGFYSAVAKHNCRKKAVVAVLVLFMMACGFSRLWLCAHTPQDVACGLFLGAASMFFVSFILSRIDDDRKLNFAFVCFMIFSVTMLLFFNSKPYPIDYDSAGQILVDPDKMKTDTFKNIGIFIGVLCGILFERKIVNFSTETPALKKVLRFISGLIILLVMDIPVKMIFLSVGGQHWGNFIVHLLIFFFISGGIPFLFKKIDL